MNRKPVIYQCADNENAIVCCFTDTNFTEFRIHNAAAHAVMEVSRMDLAHALLLAGYELVQIRPRRRLRVASSGLLEDAPGPSGPRDQSGNPV